MDHNVLFSHGYGQRMMMKEGDLALLNGSKNKNNNNLSCQMQEQ